MRKLTEVSIGRFLFLLAAVLALALAPVAAEADPHPDFEVTVIGHGKPIIFIPGLSTPGVLWQPVVSQLEATWQCHVISLAGFGKVKPSGSNPFLPRVRDELLDYIRTEKLDHPVIVGHSLGGFLAMWMAETAPDLPGRLVLVDSLPFLPALLNPAATPESMRVLIAPIATQISDASPEQFAKLEEETFRPMVTSPENAEKVIAMSVASDPRTITCALEELMTTDLRPDLAKIACPVLVLVAVADKVAQGPKETVLANFRAQYERLHGVRFACFDNARHFIMVDDFPGFMKSLGGELKNGSGAK